MPVKRKRTVKLDQLQVVAQSFVETDDNTKMFGAQADALKKRLMLMIEEGADPPDEFGHQYVELPEPVTSYTTSGKGERREEVVTGFQRMRRRTTFIDAERAEAWLKKHKLWDECTEEVTVREISEERLWALVFDQRYSKEEIDALYGESITYALNRVK